MKALRIAVIKGDGIGPEVVDQALRFFPIFSSRTKVPVTMEEFPFSADSYLSSGRTLTEDDLRRFREDFDAIFFGALGDVRVADQAHARDVLLGLRFRLDLFINFRPVRLLHETLCPLKGKRLEDVRFVVFRENTQDLYRGIGGTLGRNTNEEVAIETMIHTHHGVSRILNAACDYARRKGLKRVCMVDKSNALTHGHGIWKRLWEESQARYTDLQLRHLYVDAAAMEMVRAPEQFDVIVTTNLFGDILSDLGAQLQGGMGFAASANLHPGGPALFEPVHGSAPNLAGKGSANPCGAILTLALLFDHFGFSEESQRLEASVARVISRNILTPDVGGSATTGAMADAILAEYAN